MRIKALFVSNALSRWSTHTSTFVRQTLKVSEIWFSYTASYLRLLLPSLTTNVLTSYHRTSIICNPYQFETKFMCCTITLNSYRPAFSVLPFLRRFLSALCAPSRSQTCKYLFINVEIFFVLAVSFFPVCYVWGWVNNYFQCMFNICHNMCRDLTSFFNLVPLLLDALGPLSHNLLYAVRINKPHVHCFFQLLVQLLPHAWHLCNHLWTSQSIRRYCIVIQHCSHTATTS